MTALLARSCTSIATRWLGTWPTSRAKTCTWLMGFFALAGGLAVVEPPLRAALAGLKPGATAARSAFRNASLAPAALRVWRKSSDGAKSIPRCSINFAPDSSPKPSRTMLTTCSCVKGLAERRSAICSGGVPTAARRSETAATALPSFRAACRNGGGTCPDPIGTPPWRGKLAATPARAGLKPCVMGSC